MYRMCNSVSSSVLKANRSCQTTAVTTEPSSKVMNVSSFPGTEVLVLEGNNQASNLFMKWLKSINLL